MDSLCLTCYQVDRCSQRRSPCIFPLTSRLKVSQRCLPITCNTCVTTQSKRKMKPFVVSNHAKRLHLFCKSYQCTMKYPNSLVGYQYYHVQKRFISHNSTRNMAELEKFKNLNWAGNEGKALAVMHETRMTALLGYLKQHQMFINEIGTPFNLKGKRVLDVGCGGGLLSRSLIELQADVVAIDAVHKNVEYTRAQVASILDSGTIIGGSNICGSFEGLHCTVEELLAERGNDAFDLVISLEVIEHVDEQQSFIDSLCRLSKSALAISTINRTIKSFALAIVAAEYVVGMVPRGTHDWTKFVQPHEIESALHKRKFHCDNIVGMVYNPVTGDWSSSSSMIDVNYILFASR